MTVVDALVVVVLEVEEKITSDVIVVVGVGDVEVGDPLVSGCCVSVVVICLYL